MIKFNELKKSCKSGIHEILFQLDILDLNEDDKVESYFDKLPIDIKLDGERWGFNDSVVQGDMHVFFESLK